MRRSVKEEIRFPAGHLGNLALLDPVSAKCPPHRHDALEFNLVTRGRGSYIVDDRVYELQPGTLIWLFPEQDHVLVDRLNDLAFWLFVVDQKLVQKVAKQPPYAALADRRAPDRFVKVLPMQQLQHLANICQYAVTDREDIELKNAGLQFVMLQAWRAFLDSDHFSDGADLHPAIEKAVQLIRAGKAEMGIDELGETCGLSGSRLSRLFKQQVGISLARFRQQQNLQRFFDIYQRGRRINMMEAALQAGFGSYAQFHRVFTEQMSMSPNDYRREQRDET